jgi:hypothetical protein
MVMELMILKCRQHQKFREVADRVVSIPTVVDTSSIVLDDDEMYCRDAHSVIGVKGIFVILLIKIIDDLTFSSYSWSGSSRKTACLERQH